QVDDPPHEQPPSARSGPADASANTRGQLSGCPDNLAQRRTGPLGSKAVNARYVRGRSAKSYVFRAMIDLLQFVLPLFLIVSQVDLTIRLMRGVGYTSIMPRVSMSALNRAILDCERCPRLREH